MYIKLSIPMNLLSIIIFIIYLKDVYTMVKHYSHLYHNEFFKVVQDNLISSNLGDLDKPSISHNYYIIILSKLATFYMYISSKT